MPLPLDQVLELVTDGLVEVCAVLLLLAVAAWVRTWGAAARRRELAAQSSALVVLGSVVDEPPARG